MIIRYSPGRWFGVVTPHGVAVLPPEMPVHVVDDVWKRMEAGEGLPAVLEALAAAFGTSLSSLPPFGLVLIEGGGCRVAVRGSITVTAGTGQQPVSGLGVSTWTERAFDDAPQFALEVAEAQDDLVGMLSLRAGVVLCDALLCGDEGVGTVEAAATPVEAVSTPPAATMTQSPPALVDVATPATPPPIPAEDAGMTMVPDATLAVDAASDSPSEPSAATMVDAPSATPTRTDEGGDYDELFGATVIRSVEDAAIRAAADEGASEGEASSSAADGAASAELAAPAPTTAPSPVPPPIKVAQREEAAGNLIAGVPSYLTGEPVRVAEASSVAEPAEEGDHDGLTVSVAQLRAMRAGSASVDQVAARGRAHISTGEEVLLDRSVVVGRKPRASRTTGDLPHLVTVPSPDQDISRSHVEIRVESGAVLAVDLDTTNGTVLRRIGAEPKRLHPHEPTIVLDGDVLEIGDGITITLEGVS